jgi:Dictyostelium (slime mold) repeat
MLRSIITLLATLCLVCGASSPASAQTGWAVFANGGKVYIASVGGSPKPLYSGSVAHAVWSAKATTIYFIKTSGEIWRMNNDGSGAKKIASGKNSSYNPIAGYRPDDTKLLYAAGTKLYKVDGSSGAMTQIYSGFKTWVGELAIDSGGTKAAARDTATDIFKISIGGGETFYDNGCSASVSADGNYLTANVTGHVTLKIYKWSGGELKTLSAPSGAQWDNQKFAVNSSDWIVYKYDGTSAIGLVRVSDNTNTKICSMSSDYPDFFLGSLPPASGGCSTDGDCADADACTKDTCVSNACQHAAISGCCSKDADCADSNPCTTDTCDSSSGNCSNKKVQGCCVYDTDCGDGDACTLDTCDTNKHVCVHKQTCAPDSGGSASDSGPLPIVDAGTGSIDVGAADSGLGSTRDASSSADQGGGVHGASTNQLEGGCNLGARPPALPGILLALALLALLPRRRGTLTRGSRR